MFEKEGGWILSLFSDFLFPEFLFTVSYWTQIEQGFIFRLLWHRFIQFSDCEVSSASIESEALSLTAITLTQLHSSLN